MDSMRTSLTFRTTSREPSLNTREFYIVKAMTMNRILRIVLTHYLIHFSRRLKLLSKPAGFMFYGQLGIDFFSTSEMLYPNTKIRLRLIRARPNFHMISGNPNVSLGIVDCSLYTRRIALKESQKENGHASLCSCRIKLFGDFGKGIHHTCETKPIHPRKYFQPCSHSSSRDCKELKVCLYWFFYWKPILASTI